MTRRVASVAPISSCAVILFALWQAQAQTAATSPQFEVSSVKQNLSQSDQSKLSDSIPNRFVVTNYPAIFLILYAYDLKGHQLVGAPEWTWNKAYDIVATYPEQQPTNSQIRIMLQNLLAARFGLKLHREQRELPAYDLVVARKDRRLGPQLLKSNVDCAAWMTQKHRPSRIDAGGPSPVSPSGKRPECTIVATRRYLTGGAQTMQALAGPLEAMLDRPVVDRTGLAGAYDIDLQWAPTDLHAGEAPNAVSSEGPSLFTAVEEQLGLKLVPHKEKVEVVVVDRIDPPGPN
jgi:uncharacterized protein (TIGR03435 family)